jgi:RNA polymerase sigma-70 factor (ECF subfamily)
MLVDFHSIFERHAQDVYRFTLFLSADPSLAEEVTQETFVRAWVAREEISGGTVKAYLLTIARNLFLAEKKRAMRQMPVDHTLVDPSPGPEALVEGRVALNAVLEALRAIPEIDRAALLMSAQDHLPYAAVANALGLSTAAVKVRVHRARLKLRHLCRLEEGEP